MRRREFLVNAGLAAALSPGLARATPCPPSVVRAGTSSVGTACGPSTAPAWFTAMPDKTWTAIAGGSGYGASYQSGSRVFDVTNGLPYTGNEGPSAIINDWTGGCANQVTKEVFLPAQGGHSGLFDTWVLALNLSAAQPGWQMIWMESHAQVLSSELGYNPVAFSHADGNPRPTHGWFNVFCDNNNRIWITMIDANPSGSWGTNCYSIDRNNLSAGWMYHGRLWATVPGGSPGSSFGYQSGAGAFDPTNNKIWKRADFYVSEGVVEIDCANTVAAGAQSQTTGPQTPHTTFYVNKDEVGKGPAPSVITTATVVPCWINLISGRPEVMDLTNPGNNFNESLSASGTAQQPGGAGAVWHAPSNAVLTYDVTMGTSIGKLALSSNDPRSATYTWSSVSAASGNTVTPSADTGGQYNGTFSKLQLIEDMGNGQGALVVMCGYQGPTYVYKLPLAGV